MHLNKVALLFVVALLFGEWRECEAQRLLKVSSKLLEAFSLKNTTTADDQLENLTENVSAFLDSIHSKRKEKSANLLLRAVKKYAENFDLERAVQSPEDLQCMEDIKIMTADIASLKLYALQMQDSWASRQGGMLEGNVRWTGHYWECVNAISDAGNFKGKYCTTYYGFTYVPISSGVPYDITFDSCYPNSCSDEMIQNLTRLATVSDIRAPVLETTCSKTIEKSFNGFDIAIIVVSSILLFLASCGTLHDIMIRTDVSRNTKQWMLCFSVLKNGEKILSTKTSPNNIAAINGIRVFSTFWVIIGHSIAIIAPNFDNIIVVGQEFRRRFEMMAIANGTYSVDTFFLIAGLLTSYLTLKQLYKTKGKLNIPMMYLHRYLRLTPLYAYCLIFSMGLYKFLGSGPRWTEQFENNNQFCLNDWWANLVYINNVYPITNFCFGHAWYLACDMQFYILSPLFIYSLYKWPRIGVLNTTFFMLASVAVTWALSENSNLQPTAIFSAMYFSILSRLIPMGGEPVEQTFKQKYEGDVYYTPWCRISVYLIGILAGYILHKTQRKMKLSKIVVFLGWLLATGTGLSIVYGLYPATSEPRWLDVHVAAFYTAITRPLWGVCVAWVIIACTCGYGGPVTEFLNWSLFLPLSRLTYGAYLIHLYVLYWNANVQENYLHYSGVWLAYAFCGHVIIAFGLAFLAALFVEWPCQEILKVLLPSGRSGKPPAASTTKPERISLEKPPSYRSEDQSYVLDEINKTPIEVQHENEKMRRRNGEDNLTFDKNETFSTKI